MPSEILFLGIFGAAIFALVILVTVSIVNVKIDTRLVLKSFGTYRTFIIFLLNMLYLMPIKLIFPFKSFLANITFMLVLFFIIFINYFN